ncbi:MAG: alpha/beta hydrolase [Candidatus Pacebacteria bacterium]|nr:alpha/beta hydrolase [Candidatus Paceibacterota bacterium]
MKKQVVVIHGGDTFKSYKDYLAFLKSYEIEINKLKTKRWKETLAVKLGKGFEVIYPKMPNPMNAKYKEWKIIFEKLLPFLRNNVILLGHSLGAAFLAKYLAENKFPKRIMAVFLVSAPFSGKSKKYSLADFKPPKSLKNLEKQTNKIVIYYSKDDKVVPFSDMKKYVKALPGAKTVIFKNRGHFNQTELPELIKEIKRMV